MRNFSKRVSYAACPPSREELMTTSRVLADLPDIMAGARLRSGLTRPAIAKQVGLHTSGLAQIENRNIRPSLETTQRCISWLLQAEF